MKKGMRTRLVLSTMILAVILLILPIFLALALPSAFEEDRSGNDLDELEAMLSGEHRGSSYGTEGTNTNLYSSSQPVQAILGPSYDPPYKNAFQNDTYFGDFIRQLYGASTPEINQTWSEIFLNGTLYLNISGKKAEKPSGHFIKPILIEEPDF
jgi:hypothetical protein